MDIKLMHHTPNPDRVCAAAAFTSWKKHAPKELFEELTDKEAMDFLRSVIGFGHLSVTEHAAFTYGVSGVSRACTHELVRHRIASYTQQSQRYVKFGKGEIEYVTPKTVERDADIGKKYDDMMGKIADLYDEMLKKGVPAEDARYILPNAATTKIVVTMNARELRNFLGLRMCIRAQWEIRELANRMLAEAKKAAPVLFDEAGPNCMLLGYCPEGKLTCGLIPVKDQLLKVGEEKYNELVRTFWQRYEKLHKVK